MLGRQEGKKKIFAPSQKKTLFLGKTYKQKQKNFFSQKWQKKKKIWVGGKMVGQSVNSKQTIF